MCPGSITGVPFDSVRRFRATLLLRTNCMPHCCNWVASRVAAYLRTNQKPNKNGVVGEWVGAWASSSPAPYKYLDVPHTTVFGKHCECIAQKCTHLEHLPPLASHLLLPSHCGLTRHGGKKIDNRNLYVISGIRTPNTFDQDSRIYRLSQSNSRKQWVVPCLRVNADLFKHQIITFCWGPKNSVNARAENNESFIYISFKLYMQV